MTFGIYVLTTAYKETINGMIASWVSMISYNPPLIMAAVHPNRYSHKILEKSACFALNILSQNQKNFLSRFKGPDPNAKFTGIDYKKGITGSYAETAKLWPKYHIVKVTMASKGII